MEKHSDVFATISKITDLINKNKIGQEGEEALILAIKSIAGDLADQPPPPKPSVSPEQFAKQTLSRLNEYSSKKTQSLTEKRRKKLEDISDELQDKPIINPNSRRLYPSGIPPLYKRVDKVIKQKDKYLKSLQREPEEDLSISKPKGEIRTIEEFNLSVNAWNERRLQQIEEKAQTQARLQTSEVKDKPEINHNSKKIFDRTKKDPVFERLVAPRPAAKHNSFSFIPKINNRSHSLSRDQTVHDRLYTPKIKAIKAEEKNKKKRNTNRSEQDIRVVYHKSGYRVNTSFGTVNSELPIHEVRYMANLSFMEKSLNKTIR